MVSVISQDYKPSKYNNGMRKHRMNKRYANLTNTGTKSRASAFGIGLTILSTSLSTYTNHWVISLSTKVARALEWSLSDPLVCS
jgi:hypothetical protein